jgi:thioredoxin 1
MSVLHINNSNFDSEVIGSDKPVLLDFFASWCGPCKMLSPVIDAFADEHPEYKICKINVDEEQELAQKYGVMSIPTLVVVRDGEVASRAVGYRRKEQLLELLEG